MRLGSLLFFALFPVLLLSPLQARGLNRASLDEYRSHLEKLRGVVEGCEAASAGCDAGAVGADEQVQIRGLGAGANADSFEAHYDWLARCVEAGANDRGQAARGCYAGGGGPAG